MMMFDGDVILADRQPGALFPERPETIEGGEGVCVLGIGRLSPFSLDISRMGKAHGPVTVVVESYEEWAAGAKGGN